MIYINIFLILFVISLSNSYNIVSSEKKNYCPATCSCDSQAVFCERGVYDNGQLALLFSDLPPQIKTLTVVNAYFPILPIFNKKYSSLESLNIIYCELEKIQNSGLKYLTLLTSISFHNNVIQRLDENLFQGQSILRDLDLSKNKLKTLPNFIFSNLHNLQNLSLQYNHISFIPFHVFSNLTNLQVLNLSYNEISRLSLALFDHLVLLKILDLSSNRIQTMHESVLPLIHHKLEIDLHDNPWRCMCGLDWIINAISNNLKNRSSKFIFNNPVQMKCATPPLLRGKSFNEIISSNLTCISPHIYDYPQNSSVFYRTRIEMKCKAKGEPQPAIIWITPWNDTFVHETNWHLLPPSLIEIYQEKNLFLPPYYQKHSIGVEQDGILWISHFRLVFSGEYKCIAWNIAGNEIASAILNVTSPLLATHIASLIIGASAVGCMLLIGVTTGIIMCCYDKYRKKHLIYISNCNVCFNANEKDGCGNCKQYMEYSPDNPEIMISDNVKTRMKCGMGKRVKCVRGKVKIIKDTSNQYVQTIRDTSSHYVQSVRDTSNYYMQTLRDSSSQYTQRMIHGVEKGMEHVKYHVQSIKEFCGTGDLGQTISQVSVSTDVDTNTKTEVVKKITYV